MFRHSLVEMLSRAVLPAACCLVLLYFGGHAVTGPTGIMALDGIRAEQAALLQRQSELKAKKAALERDIALLDPRGVDPDLADELVRRQLGVVRPDEVIVQLDP